jgi:hypothetical protein
VTGHRYFCLKHGFAITMNSDVILSDGKSVLLTEQLGEYLRLEIYENHIFSQKYKLTVCS